MGGAAAALGLAVGAAAKPLGKPKLPRALKPGDRIAITSPAGAADGPQHLESASEKIRSLGWEPVVSKNATARYGYLAGTDGQRAEDLNTALRDETIAGILYLRGGYGAMRILPALDYDAMRRRPIVTMGFSDITALHLAFLARSGVVTFHGPCAESRWSEFSRSSLPIVTVSQPFGTVLHPVEGGAPKTTLVPGKGRGRIVAGNLSLVVALAGTPYLPSLKGCILCLEDIGEDPYRVDRMLTHLLLTGQLKDAEGIIFGDFRERRRPGEEPDKTPANETFNMEQVLLDRCQAIGIPAFSGLSFGHIGNNHILPLGVMATLDAGAKSLTLTESAVG